MRVLIGLPSTTGFWLGDVWLNILSQARGVNCEILRQEGLLISKARDNICRFAIDNNFDYVYMQDDDNTIDEGALIKLIAHDKDIIGVPIMQRNQNDYTCVLKRVNDTKFPDVTRHDKIHKDELKGKGLIRVDAIGCGAILIKTSVLKEMYSKIPSPFQQIVWIREQEGLAGVFPQGEDISFCINANSLGFEIWCDCSINSKHYGKVEASIYEN